jgi:hypothetical protein
MDRYSLIKHIVSDIKDGVFVEIGTFNGEFSDYILSCNSTATLYCIDPYLSYDTYDDSMNNTVGDKMFEEVKGRLVGKYGDRVKFIRKLSEEAVNDIPDKIDFLYIDGNHRYTYVLKDLELYFPKVKDNFYIVGDDAVDTDDTQRNENGDVLRVWAENCFGHYGVIKAFNEYLKNNNYTGSVIGTQYLVKKVKY